MGSYRGPTSPNLQIPDDQSFVDTNLRAVITTTDALDGSSTFFSDSLTVQNVDDDASASIFIDGPRQEGATLWAWIGNFTDPDGSLANTSFQWQQRIDDQWVDLDGQTSSDLQILMINPSLILNSGLP